MLHEQADESSRPEDVATCTKVRRSAWQRTAYYSEKRKRPAGQVSRAGQDDAQMKSKNSKKQKKGKRRRDVNNKRRR